MEKNNSIKKNTRFSHWFFDLDNTLYCANSGIFDQIHKKMGEFISSNQNVSLKEENKNLQNKLFHSYDVVGTSQAITKIKNSVLLSLIQARYQL